MTIYTAAELVVNDGIEDITYYSGFLTGLDALRVRIGHRLARFRGEWFADRNIGALRMPSDANKPSAATYATWLRSDLEACPGVDRVSVLTVSTDNATGHLTASGTIHAEQQSIPVAIRLPSSVSGIGNVPPSTSVLSSTSSPTWVF
ncbi:MAG: hypothetical protein JSV86_13175 [Gemmatimonadota bacterium]|nr:MAG: hypothetical protein JSV86_13175 [Gemmatimonadota bacterium]